MEERKKNLVKTIVEEYVKTVQPVSSKFITESGNFNLSSATIRNEMAELEAEGYIYHPHTSSGRIPTEKGYQFYVDSFLEDSGPNKKAAESLDKLFDSQKAFEPVLVKNLAKDISELSDATVFIAFSPHDFYYTGLSKLFAQPEFINHELVYNLSRVIDHLDSILNKIFQQVQDEVEIAIGRANPFSADCSSVLAKYEINNEDGLIGILGPMRMDYQNNFSLVKYGRSLINNLK